MKLSDIEDADRLVTRDQLEVALGRLENHVDQRFNSLDARINRVERSVWFLVIAAVIQVLAIFGPVVVKMVLKQWSNLLRKNDLAKLKTDLIRTLVTWQLINVAMVFGTYALIVGLYLRY
jgi:hypothetical protein